MFELLDTQNKGVIGPDELQEVVQQDGMVVENAQEDVLQLLQGIDIDGSNSLNYREFLAATMEASGYLGGSAGISEHLDDALPQSRGAVAVVVGCVPSGHGYCSLRL